MIANVGTLNKKVDIISGVAGEFNDFETIDDNILYKNIWASIQPLRGKEYLEVKRPANEETVKITIRYRDNIDEGCKVRYHKQIFEVVSIVDPEMTHEVLELRCVEKKRGNTATGLKFKQSEEWST